MPTALILSITALALGFVLFSRWRERVVSSRLTSAIAECRADFDREIALAMTELATVRRAIGNGQPKEVFVSGLNAAEADLLIKLGRALPSQSR